MTEKNTKADDNVTDTPVTMQAYISRADLLALFPVPMSAQKLAWLVKGSDFPKPITLSRGDVWYPADAAMAWLAATFGPQPLVTRSKGGRRGSYGKV